MPTTNLTPTESVGLLNLEILPKKNTIVFLPLAITAGQLQPPFFDHELPFSMNFGGIGIVIGHELTHAFDSNGAKYDGHGKPVNWWTPETLATFNERTKCFVDQYSAVHDPLSGANVS